MTELLNIIKDLEIFETWKVLTTYNFYLGTFTIYQATEMDNGLAA